MTGSAWGRSPAPDAGSAFAVEARSVNGKGLLVKTRVPTELAAFERAIEDRVRARFHRGTVFVQVAVERSAAVALERVVDPERFAAAATRLRALAELAGLDAPRVADVLAVPGVLASASSAPGPGVAPPRELVAAVDAVLDGLCTSREVEGDATVLALRSHLDEFERSVAAVTARAPRLIEEHRARLIQRVNEFLAGRGLQLEPDDVVRELGVFADRVDVDEELQRLAAHVARAREMLDAGGQVGRSLEFLFQELLRETNTIGSKSPDVEVAHEVVAMKSAVDRLKEQAANLE